MIQEKRPVWDSSTQYQRNVCWLATVEGPRKAHEKWRTDSRNPGVPADGLSFRRIYAH